MNIIRDRAALILAVISLVFSGFLFWKSSKQESPEEKKLGFSESSASEIDISAMREDLSELSAEIDELTRAVGATSATDPSAVSDAGGDPDTNPPPFASIDERLRTLESSLARLQSNYDGISIEGASAERAELFASDEGALKADEYFEAGKFSIAAEGYLTFFRNHPEDPDSRSVLDRARRAYVRAGYSDMAIWVQEEKMRIFPEARAEDLKQLATMQKEAGNYDAAITHAAESAELAPNAQERLWTRMYWAWYNQLRDGAPAGLDAYLEVQREIESAGYTDHKLNEKIQSKIDEVRKEIAAGQ